MTAEQRLRFATDELERALRDVKHYLLAWRVAVEASPTAYALDQMEALCRAVDYADVAQERFDEAQINALAEWQEREASVRRAEAGYPGKGGTTPAFARRAIAQTPAHPGDAGAVARSIQFSRED